MLVRSAVRHTILALSFALLLPACGDKRDESPNGSVGDGGDGGDPDDGADDGGDDGGDGSDDGGSDGGDTTGDGDPDTGGDGGSGTDPGDDGGTDTGDGGGGDLDPPEGESSGGNGGPAGGSVSTPDGVNYNVITPGGSGPHPLMIVYSGTEGGQTMTSNLQQVGGMTGCGSFVFAVLDGTTYYGNGQAGASVLDHVRSQYDIDNDRTYLLSESAGTSAGLELGLQLRQSYFAAYWANDVNASATPTYNADQLGFAPYGNAGPGGDFPDANAIVSGMQAAGYRTPAPAPYDGPGSGTHGDTDQFLAALSWFPGKTRQ